jgi:hypothetical protein
LIKRFDCIYIVLMKPLLLALSLVVAVSANALTVVSAGDRVAVLRPDDQSSIAGEVRRNLTLELRTLGVDAFDANFVFADAKSADSNGARYLLQVVSIDTKVKTEVLGDVVTSPVSSTLITDIRATVNVELRLYDAKSLTLLRRYEVHENAPDNGPLFGAGSIGPRGVSVGPFFLWPFVRHSKARSAARAAAREAALMVANVNQLPPLP